MNTLPRTRSAKYVRPLVFAVSACMLAACDQGPSPSELAARAETDSLTAQLQSRDSLISEMTLSFEDIEKNISLMEDQQRILGTNAGGELNVDKRKKIVHDLQLMNGLMQESRDRIAELTKRLDKSKIEAGGLRKKLKELDMQLAMRDSSMTSLKDQLVAKDFQIGQVNEQLTAIELEVAKREAIIAEQTDKINTAWYTVGTSKELEARGVVNRKGGLLGIGKSTSVNGDATAAEFKQVDIRTMQRFPLQGKEAILLTEHPKSSYTIVENGDALAYLEVKDPEAFWHQSKYMVVEVK